MNSGTSKNIIALDRCPGTLSKGHTYYSTTCLKKVYSGIKVSPFLNYPSPSSNEVSGEMFEDNRKRISISGVQEKFSVIQDKNQLLF